MARFASSPEQLAESKSMDWKRIPGFYNGNVGSRYILIGTKYSVSHCGHPTAIWPYHGTRPDGSMILSPNGRGFQFLADAKAATIREYRASLAKPSKKAKVRKAS